MKSISCGQLQQQFYSYPCVSRGEFYSSKCIKSIKEKFSEKKLKLYSMMEWQKDVDSMITDLMVFKTRITQIDSVVSDKQFMVDRLKAILNDKKTRLGSTKSNHL